MNDWMNEWRVCIGTWVNLNQMHFNLYELKIADESNVGVIKKKNQTNEEDTEENITRTV